MSRGISGARRRSRGGSVVEVAISLPAMCLLVLATADIGRAHYYREAVANAARQALRVAASQSQQATGNAACGSSGGVASSTLPPPGGSAIATIVNDMAVESSTTGAASGSVISGATVTVTWHCAGSLAVTNTTNGGITDPADSRSDAIDVRVAYAMAVITPVLGQAINGGSVLLQVDMRGRAEY